MTKVREDAQLTNEDIVTAVENMSVLQLSELVKMLEEKFGVTAAPSPAASGGVVPSGGAVAPVVEEKTTFDVVLVGSPAEKKIQVIKVVRELTNLGLKDAKDLVEGAPKPVKTGISKEEAETLKGKLEAVGAKIDIK